MYKRIYLAKYRTPAEIADEGRSREREKRSLGLFDSPTNVRGKRGLFRPRVERERMRSNNTLHGMLLLKYTRSSIVVRLYLQITRPCLRYIIARHQISSVRRVYRIQAAARVASIPPPRRS